MASGLEIDEFEFLFGTPRTPEGAADPGSIAPRIPPGQGRGREKFVGLLVCWFVGWLVCWFVGLLVCWFVSLLVCWFVLFLFLFLLF